MRDTGLSHGGFYKDFESKDELLMESLKEVFHEIEKPLVREEAPHGGGVEGNCEHLPKCGYVPTSPARLSPGTNT